MSDTWIVTGGSSDIAAALFDELDKRSGEKITVFAQFLSHEIDTDRANIDIRPIRADLRDPDEVQGFISAIKDSGLTPTHIIHLAAVPYSYVKVKNWDETGVDEQMRVALYSFAAICKEFLPVMAKAKSGWIVVMLTSAVTRVRPTPGICAVKGEDTPKFLCEYISVKSALMGYTESLASEYSSKGIDIYTVSPGMMETKFLRNIDPRIVEMDAAASEGGAHRSPAELASEILGRISRPDDRIS